MTLAEAAECVNSFNAFSHVVPDNAGVYQNWKELVNAHQVSGENAHDANHVAAMRAHGIPHIFTFDIDDFRRYFGVIRVSTPADVLKLSPI